MSNEPSTHLYLVRHGQAVSNVEPILGGMRGDKGLTPLGVRQAERLRDRLKASGEIRAEVLIASSLPRARQTAQIVAPALGLPIVFDDEVQELRVGDEADGLTLDEYKRRFGWVDIEAEPNRLVYPGGESWVVFTDRVRRALTRIVSEHTGKTVVVVCHGGIIDVSFLHFFGMPLDRLPPARFYTRNTSITHWEHVAIHAGPMRWRLVRYNDDTHLHDIGPGRWLDWTTTHAAPAAEGEEKSAVPLPTEGEGR